MKRTKISAVILIAAVIAVVGVIGYKAHSDYQRYYKAQAYVVLSGRRYSNSILHKKGCTVILGKDVEGASESDIIAKYIDNEATICPVCNPEKPSLNGIVTFLNNCNLEKTKSKNSDRKEWPNEHIERTEKYLGYYTGNLFLRDFKTK